MMISQIRITLSFVLTALVMGCAGCSTHGPPMAALDAPAEQATAHAHASPQHGGNHAQPSRDRNLQWGEEVNHIQTAIKAIRSTKPKHITIFFYARNTSDHHLLVGASPPRFGKSHMLLLDPNGEKITGEGGAGFGMQLLHVPPDMVLSWQESPMEPWFVSLLKARYAAPGRKIPEDGRCMLTWVLHGAASPPLYLRVQGDRVTVYKDKWETVKFRFILPEIEYSLDELGFNDS